MSRAKHVSLTSTVSDMRASRLVSIILLLQARGQLTAGQLAAELEVSVRTIYRDVGSLQAAGIPLYGDAGPAGGYQLVAGYRTRLTGMTAAEAEALALAGIPGPAAELGLGGVLAAAQLKLDAALPAEMRSRAALVRERFHLDAPGWYHDGDAVPLLSEIADTVWKQQRIDVRYRRWRAPTDVTRRLDPHGLVLKAGKWYLVAGDDQGMRTYRISQILDLAVLAETFERAADFDLAEYWTAGISEFRAGLLQGHATIRLSPAGRDRAVALYNAETIRALRATASPPDQDGWVTAIVPIESAENAQSEFLRLGADVEIIEPPELRARISDVARGLAAIYPADRPSEASF
jgi:predicted DNA-binding transcriptional regulator YafY